MLDLVITAGLTFVMTLLLTWIQNRRTLLTYHVTHNRIGTSGYDNIHGEVLVTVGGNRMQNLYISDIWLINRSICDVENLEIKIYTGTEQLQLMTERTHIEGTVEFLKHTREYEEIKKTLQHSLVETERAKAAGDTLTVAQLHQAQAANWEIWSTQRWYEVPVIARGQAIRFSYMTNAISDVSPVIYISCQKAGVRVKYKEPYQPILHLWGVPIFEASLTGIVIGICVWWIIIYSISIQWFAALLCLIVGLLANIPGAAAVKSYRWLRDKLVG